MYRPVCRICEIRLKPHSHWIRRRDATQLNGQRRVATSIRFYWLTVLSVVPFLWHDVSSVCLSVVCLSVTFCIVAKRCVLAKKCLKE